VSQNERQRELARDEAAEHVADDQKVEEMVDDIERTRSEMTQTVDEIEARLDPANIVNAAKETVREATVGRVEDMANTAADMVSEARYQARDAGTGIVETIRRNPLPAALAGIGIGWLWMNRSSGEPSGLRRTYSYSDRSGDRGSDRGPRGYGVRPGMQPLSDVRESLGGSASAVAEAAGDARDELGRQASRVVGSATDAAGDAVDEARRFAGQVPEGIQDVTRDVRYTTQRVFEENPLAVGVAAVAVGAAIGMALPATRTERRVLGPTSERVVDQAQAAISGPLEEAEREMRKAESEAR
jgi:ElaB/YqjD/DUF883 family membrane-anchored ribosome-binding protein